MMELLLKAGASIESDCFIVAAVNQQHASMKLLLRFSKQVDPLDVSRVSALENAVINSDVECCKLLLAAGANPVRNNKNNALEYALEALKYPCLREKIENARNVLIELLKNIQSASHFELDMIDHVIKLHREHSCTMQEKEYCNFCEFFPDLKAQFGG